MIAFALRFQFAIPILPIRKIQLIILLVFVQVTISLLLACVLYGFIVNNRGIKVIDEARYIQCGVDEAGSKRGMASTSSDNILLKMYVQYRDMHSIKFCIKLINAFGYVCMYIHTGNAISLLCRQTDTSLPLFIISIPIPF